MKKCDVLIVGHDRVADGATALDLARVYADKTIGLIKKALGQ